MSLRQGFCNQGVSWSSSFEWTGELCNQHISQVGVLVMYLDPCINWLVTYLEPCIEKKDCHYITSPIGYWSKGSTVGCFDNSGFSRVVTLNSPNRVLPRWFSPFVNKSPVSNLFFAAYNLVGDLFMLPRSLHVIKSN